MTIIDLTLPIYTGMNVFPGDEEVNIEQVDTLENDGWNMKRIHMNGHDGTHVNVPIHCVESGKTLDNYSIHDFRGESFLYEKYYKIEAEKGIVFQNHISEKILLEILKTKPKFVGLTKEVDIELEKILLAHDIILFERLTNTEKLPEKFIFYGIPLKIIDGDGSPIRAFAEIC